MTRIQTRGAFDMATRVTLLEQDQDDHETAIDHLRDELKGTNRILTGLLISVATAGILLAINIAVQAAGG